MSSALTVLNQDPIAIQLAAQGGVGLPADSRLFELKPDTVTINQPNTQHEGAIKGHLRLSGGDQYEFLNVVILDAPREWFDYFVGEPGTLYRTKENLMCFSRDRIKPDRSARSPQSLLCGSCNKSMEISDNWEKYRQTKNKADMPGCEATLSVLLLDTNWKIPLRMYLRSAARKAFKTGLKDMGRKLEMMKSQGINPNIFDIAFKLSTKPLVTGRITNYVPFLSEFRGVTAEERQEFLAKHIQYVVNAQQRNPQPEDTEAQANQVSESIDTQAADSSYEITI